MIFFFSKYLQCFSINHIKQTLYGEDFTLEFSCQATDLLIDPCNKNRKKIKNSFRSVMKFRNLKKKTADI